MAYILKYIQMRSTHSLLVGFALLTILLSVFGRTQASVNPGVVINEVLYNPSGTDTGYEWVELYNPTCEPIDLTSYELTAASGSFYVFPNFILSPNRFVVVRWRLDGVNTTTDLYTGSVGFTTNMGNTTGYVALFNGTVHTQATIVDYVAYGAGGQSWESTAVGANIWQSGNYVENASEGSSIGLLADGQDTNSSSNWSIHAVPTRGAGNDNVPDDTCVTPTPTFEPSPSPTLTPTITPLPSPTLQPSPSVTPAPSPTLTPNPIPTPTTTPVPSPTFIPTPTAIITVTITQAPTPTVSPTITPGISSTPTPIASATPIPVPTVKGVIPATVEIGSGFGVPVTIEAATPNDGYYVKFEASVDGREWYEGRTLSADASSYLAWNSAWSKYPRLQINGIGLGSVTISALIGSNSSVGPVSARIKVSRVSDGKVFYSPIYTIEITKAQPLIPTLTVAPTVLATPMPSAGQVRAVSSIREARALIVGTKVELAGVVVAPVGLLGKDTFYLGDATGGLRIQPDVKTTLELKLGDEVRLSGVVSSAYGELYLKLDSLATSEIVGIKRALAVNKYKSGSIDESKEGELIVVGGKVTKTAGSTFFVDDGTGSVKVYIKDTTRIDKPYMRVGYYVEVRGVVSQYNDEYRVLPRYQSDLIVSKTPITKGLVLGALDEVSALPATGSDAIAVYVFLLGLGAILGGLSILMAHGGVMVRRQ